LSFSVFAAQQVKETRVWPSPEYTRITIESSKEIKKTHMMLENPDRIVVDLKEVIINDALKKLSQSVQDRDPSIKGIRTAQFKPYVSRVVIDLKAMASVKVFNLKPFGSYGHRLVIDVYPNNFDPLANLLKQLEEKDSKPKDVVIDKKIVKPIIPKKEPIIIAIDAGHGGGRPRGYWFKRYIRKTFNIKNF
jgi:N-acetylmuramoyl-L-alanine amidase